MNEEVIPGNSEPTKEQQMLERIEALENKVQNLEALFSHLVESIRTKLGQPSTPQIVDYHIEVSETPINDGVENFKVMLLPGDHPTNPNGVSFFYQETPDSEWVEEPIRPEMVERLKVALHESGAPEGKIYYGVMYGIHAEGKSDEPTSD